MGSETPAAGVTIQEKKDTLVVKIGTVLFDFPVSPEDVSNEAGVNKVESVVMDVLRPDFGMHTNIFN